MRNWIFVVLAAATSADAWANSHVGNGGGEGDVELSVTLMQIQEVFQVVQKRSSDQVPLCACNKMYHGRPLCQPLEALTEEQGRFCTQSLYKIAPAMLTVLANRERIHFTWTNEPIEVREGKQTRAVDAVADREKSEITVNLPRFLKMKPAERVFLLSHELMHFVDLDGKPLEDRGAVAVFTGDDGSRGLINAMAAASAVLQGAYPREIKSYGAKLSRSKSYKQFWFGLDYGGAFPTSHYSDTFQFNQFQRFSTQFRYQFTETWGVVAGYRSESNNMHVLDTINVGEDADIFSAGIAYRHFFSSDPLTFWGQSHLVAQVLADYVTATYTVQEDPLSLSDTAKVFGASVSASYYFPLFWGFWTYAGLGYEYHPYHHDIADPTSGTITTTNYNNGLYSGWIGVSYAL